MNMKNKTNRLGGFICLLLASSLLCGTLVSCSGQKEDESGTATGTGTVSEIVSGGDESSIANQPDESETDAASEAGTETHSEPETADGTETDPSQPAGEVPDYTLEPVDTVTLPDSSQTFSATLADQLLVLSSGGTAQGTEALFKAAGFTVILHKNYDKDINDPAHTCAYTVGTGTVTYGGVERTAVLTAIRGTTAGEWYSNVDPAPSRDPDTAFAENFLLAAQDVYESLQEILAGIQNPLILVTGHSRGAACANLLGVLLNAKWDIGDTFVYTFATPTTIRKDVGVDCSNIFNIINPCDTVTMMPLPSMGYYRAGQDIILPGDETVIAMLNSYMESLAVVAPSISSYYNDRHSLTSAGLSENGMTVYEVMLSMAKMLVSMSVGGNVEVDLRLLTISKQSDLYPLMTLFTGMGSGEQGVTDFIGTSHMPLTYRQLMAAAFGTADA